MKRRTAGLLVAGLFLLVATPSCLVMKSTYQRKVDDLDALQGEYAALNDKYQKLTQEVTKLQKTNAELMEKNEALEEKTSLLKEEKVEAVAKVEDTYSNLVKDLQSEIDQKQVKIVQMEDRLSVNIVQKILFDSGKTDIKPLGFEVLNKVGESLKNIADKRIQIEGHTDDNPITGQLQARFPTNWELSTARAVRVVRYLQEVVGMDPEMLSVAGYSEFQPVADNSTPEGKAENRRIEIVLLPLRGKTVLQESTSGQ